MDSSPPGTPRTPSPSPSPAPFDDASLDGALSTPPRGANAPPSPAAKTAPAAVDSTGAADMAAAAADAPSPAHASRPEDLSPGPSLVKGKGKGKAATRPLQLLDLPVDILKDIIHQLRHTNDLTSLALCHSALHRLAIPCIYSRFDIVWPVESTHTEPRSGVDALTYGLATLVLGDDGFPHQVRHRHGAGSYPARSPATPYPVPRRRFGNYYAQFIKKFSLGNGPAAWVQEYLITKEGGKMLGTLVAIAVARMINLETFVWDMPTGVLRDVWLALSSHADRTDGEECRLDRLWIRWHNNTADSPAPPPAPPMILNNIAAPPNITHPSGVGIIHTPIVVSAPFPLTGASAIDRVEHPTFSVIPALKSLSVLDIDELPYLDEMSILIARSQKKLRELRVGIAAHAQQRDWVTAWEGEGIQQVDYRTTSTARSSISEKRLGGVLGILVGRVHNLREAEEHPSSPPHATESSTTLPSGAPTANPGTLGVHVTTAQNHDRDQAALDDAQVESAVDETTAPAEAPVTDPDMPVQGLGLTENNILAKLQSISSATKSKDETADPAEPLLNGKLKLEVLELERVPLSVSVLLKAIDWTMLTTLTLLHCNSHEQLWRSLRRTYTPRQSFPGGPPNSTKAYKASYTLRAEYSLNLKKIHTNTVSPSLIAFLKETLAPNTLEVLFLQEGRSYSSTVTVDAIFRGPLRRHRASLKKLMIDSSEKGPDGVATNSTRWRRWTLNREIITFITSGRMSSLRELAVSIDYKDWHHFLQRLPLIPHIRSIYIPNIADHAHGNNIDPRELAMQILDIVHLRPEIEICYIGISHRCFEILENRASNYDLRRDGNSNSDSQHHGNAGNANGNNANGNHNLGNLSDDESELTEDEEEVDVDADVDGEETTSEISDAEEGEDLSEEEWAHDERRGSRLRIREILFYEEKIETLRARHGVLKP